MIKLNLGSGPNVFPDWINIDFVDLSGYFAFVKDVVPTLDPEKMKAMPPEQKKLADHFARGGTINLVLGDIRKGLLYPSGSVDLIYLGQVIEHLNPIYEAPHVLRECWRVLKPGGVLRIATPDLDLLLIAYENGKMDDFAAEQPAYYKEADDQGTKLSYIMFGSGGPHSNSEHYEGHMMIYSLHSIQVALEKAGFDATQMSNHGPGHSSNPTMQAEVVDTGVSHSLYMEAVK